MTGLTTAPSAEQSAGAAPTAVSSAPAPRAVQLAAGETEQRATRGSRGTERGPLSTGTSAVVRGKVLLTQRNAIAKEEAALEQRKAAAEKKAQEAKRKIAEKKKRAAEAKKKADRAKARAAAKARAKRLGYTSNGSPKAIARQMMQSKYGWGSKQFNCYNRIIMHESKWKVHADNPSSSAYGIPQALPGSKMASAGSDWRTNPATQIKWGLGYVKNTYGTPCSAWGFKSSHGWY